MSQPSNKETPLDNKNDSKKTVTIVLVVTVIVLLTIIVFFGVWCYCFRKKQQHGGSRGGFTSFHDIEPGMPVTGIPIQGPKHAVMQQQAAAPAHQVVTVTVPKDGSQLRLGTDDGAVAPPNRGRSGSNHAARDRDAASQASGRPARVANPRPHPQGNGSAASVQMLDLSRNDSPRLDAPSYAGSVRAPDGSERTRGRGGQGRAPRGGGGERRSSREDPQSLLRPGEGGSEDYAEGRADFERERRNGGSFAPPVTRLTAKALQQHDRSKPHEDLVAKFVDEAEPLPPPPQPPLAAARQHSPPVRPLLEYAERAVGPPPEPPQRDKASEAGSRGGGWPRTASGDNQPAGPFGTDGNRHNGGGNFGGSGGVHEATTPMPPPPPRAPRALPDAAPQLPSSSSAAGDGSAGGQPWAPGGSSSSGFRNRVQMSPFARVSPQELPLVPGGMAAPRNNASRGLGGSIAAQTPAGAAAARLPSDAVMSTRSSSSGNKLPELGLSDWEIDPSELQILKDANGRDWVIGEGAFGKVYKALYKMQPVAVKELLDDSDPQGEAGFLKEMAVLRGCRSRYIVPFVGALLQPGRTLLVTDYMEGGSLFEALKKTNREGQYLFQWHNRGKRVALDIVRGLHYLHSLAIVHLDLKSPNVLLARDSTAKIADVGMAGVLHHTYLTNPGLGTWAWMAHEVLTGQASRKSDIYSFGVVLWEIISLERPDRGQMREVSVPDECPVEVRDMMLQCLHKDPQQRPTAQEIANFLMPYCMGNA